MQLYASMPFSLCASVPLCHCATEPLCPCAFLPLGTTFHQKLILQAITIINKPDSMFVPVNFDTVLFDEIPELV